MAIPNHHLGAVVGQGGMATVYRAEHVLLKQERAIKILSPELSRTPGFQESFFREGRIVASLRHPHIITVHDIGQSDEGYFMAMEYLKGGSLKERLRRGPVPLPEATLFLRQIAEALHHAHERGLIHRDIKPANILFHDDGNAVLTDFGISKLQDVEGDLTRHGYLMVGTPRYMSPEQTASQPLDRRSDVYSLALLFFEMLTGKPAIKGKDTLEVIREQALAPPPTLPPPYHAFQPVLNKALAKNPAGRYDNTLEFVRAIEERQASAGATRSANDVPRATRASTASDETTVVEIADTAASPAVAGRRPRSVVYLGGTLVALGLLAWQWPALRLSTHSLPFPTITPETPLETKTDNSAAPLPTSTATTASRTLDQGPPPPSSVVSGTGDASTPPPTGAPDAPQAEDSLPPPVEVTVAPSSEPPVSAPQKTVEVRPPEESLPSSPEIAKSATSVEQPPPLDPSPKQESIDAPPPVIAQQDSMEQEQTVTAPETGTEPTRMLVRVNPYAIVYQQPGGGERIGRAYKNSEIKVYGSVTTSDGTQWKQVLLDNKPGFLKADQLSTN